MAIPSILQIILPKKKTGAKPASYTSTFNPSQTNSALGTPNFQQHLQDIFDTRLASNSKAILTELFRHDPDVSATVNAYLTSAATPARFWACKPDGSVDPAGQKQLEILMQSLFTRTDYSTGFQFKPSIDDLSEQMRYAILLTGGISAEIIFDKLLLPSTIRPVNLNEIEWYEKSPGEYKPQQKPTGAGGTAINLDIPNFIVKFYRQNPFEIYAQSNFVSCINTIAARQQVVNDLYRIMQKVGYPRIEAKVLEEVLRKNAPADIAKSEESMSAWLTARLREVANSLTNLPPESAYVHFDSVETKMMNEGGPGKSLDTTAIIATLNAQNQAALKTMATIIGRGESGVNTASVEARIFSMSAQDLNRPIADLYSEALTLAMRLQGFSGYIVCEFDPVELRPATELEPQMVMRQSRLLENLSLGLITDEEYHIQMFNRLPPSGSPTLSGTGFNGRGNTIDVSKTSPNSDPLGRSLAPEGSNSARSNEVK